jgi:hypothetical protein
VKKPAIRLAIALVACTIIISGCGLRPNPEPTSNIQEGFGLAEQTANPTSTQSEPAPSPTDNSTEQPWKTYTNPVLQVAFFYPSGWQYIEGNPSSEKFAGSDGYFITGAIGGGGMSLDEVAQSEGYHVLKPFGTQPAIDSFTIQGQPARLILPSDDQSIYSHDMAGDAELLVQYPQPLMINDTQADFFVLHAPATIIRDLGANLTFLQSDLNADLSAGTDHSWNGFPMFTPPADWPIYTDTQAGFELRYPPVATPLVEQGVLNLKFPFAPGTQMEVKSITVDARPVVEETCYGGIDWQGVTLLNGIDFKYNQGELWEHAMGGLSFYRSDFAAYIDDMCYRVALRMGVRVASGATGNAPLPTPDRTDLDIDVLLDTLSTLQINRNESKAPAVTAALPCQTHSAAADIATPQQNVSAGDVVEVKVALQNSGCASLGLPKYHLNIEEQAKSPAFKEVAPDAVTHYLLIPPGGKDEITFLLPSLAPGSAVLSASITFEVHLGYPGPAYWASASSEELPIQVNEPEAESPRYVPYSDPETGIAFEYPSLYDQQTYENCRINKQVLDGRIIYNFGSVSYLAVSPAAGRSIEDYVRELESSGQISQVTENVTTMADQPALKVDYRFGGTNRFGTVTIVKQGNQFYAFYAEAGGMACNSPADDTFELEAYQHAIDSLSITP